MFAQLGVLDFWTYVLGAVFIVLIPGPNSMFVLRTSISKNPKEALKALGGVVVGDVVLIFLAFLGIASLIQAHPGFFGILKIIGGLYIAWLGIQIIRGMVKEEPSGEGNPIKERSTAFTTALFLSLTNPKSILFYVAFFVQFIDASFPHPGIPYLVLAAVLQTISICWLLLLIGAGRALLNFARKSKLLCRIGNGSIAALFLSFGGKLILD